MSGAKTSIPTERRAITDIIIGDRHRQDMGDIAALAASIVRVGLLHPIVIRSDNVLIAGERRLAAFKALGRTEIPVTVIDLRDVVEGELEENHARKDFLPSEMVAIKRAVSDVERVRARERQREGGRNKASGNFPEAEEGRARDKIAARVGTSGRTLEKAEAVVDAAEQDPGRFGDLAERMDQDGHVDPAFKELKRRQKEAEVSEPPSMPDGEYAVIYADPPWRFEPYSRQTGMDRAADNHYPTDSLEGIKVVPVPAGKDAGLFLWATVPMLPHALEVMEAWGFVYKSHLVWIKDRIGTGYWNRNKHELLLIGTRGAFRAPEPGTQPASAIEHPVGPHSAKPEIFRDIIAGLYPDLPKIELYCRGEPAIGWHGWGNETIGGTNERTTDSPDGRSERDHAGQNGRGVNQGHVAAGR